MDRAPAWGATLFVRHLWPTCCFHVLQRARQVCLTLHIVCVASATDVLFRNCLLGICGQRFASTLFVWHRWSTFCFDFVVQASVADVLFRHCLFGIGGRRFVATLLFGIGGRRFVSMLFVRHRWPTLCFDIVCSASVVDVLLRRCCSTSVADVLFRCCVLGICGGRFVSHCLFGIGGRRFVSHCLFGIGGRHFDSTLLFGIGG